MSVQFTDNFNRSNGGLGGNWTSLAGAGSVNGNQYAGPSSDGLDYCNTVTPGAACWAQVDLVTRLANPNYQAIALRLNTTLYNWYQIGWDSGSASIRRVDGGSATTLGSGITAPTDGTVVRLEIRGSDISVYYNDVLQATRTDATYSGAGRSAIGALGAAGRLDNFTTGTLPTISSATPSGTLGTQTTATIGCTTGDSSGTLYVVVDTASLSGITASQIKAGQNASSSAAVAAANGAVSSGSPSVGVSGLSAGTAYNYAVLQFSGGNSNILTGTFTTAAGAVNVTASPTGVSATGAVGTLAARTGSRATPAGVAGTGAVGTLTARGGVVAGVPGVSASGAAGTLATTGSARATPNANVPPIA